MKSFWTSLIASIAVLITYAIFFAPRVVEHPNPEFPSIKVEPVVLTLIQQNNTPNYQIILDSVPAEAPEGWKVVSSGRSGDLVTVK